jgi:hypothetical protein
MEKYKFICGLLVVLALLGLWFLALHPWQSTRTPNLWHVTCYQHGTLVYEGTIDWITDYRYVDAETGARVRLPTGDTFGMSDFDCIWVQVK